MTKELDAENPNLKDKEKPMVSPHVSDSEDELETDSSWALSSERLEEVLQRKILNSNSFTPIYTVSNYFNCLRVVFTDTKTEFPQSNYEKLHSKYFKNNYGTPNPLSYNPVNAHKRT